MPQSQLPWQPSQRTFECDSDLGQPAPPAGHQRKYALQHFCQTFMPQRTYYPQYLQQQQRLSLPLNANRDSAPANRDSARCDTQGTQSETSNPRTGGNFNDGPTPRQVPRQPYQSNSSYRGYQWPNEKGVYQVDDNDEFGSHLEGFYITLDQNAEEVQYSNKGFDKVDANFVGIEISCEKCGTPFFSKSQLHKYLKDGCTALVHSLLPDPSATTLTLPISIVTSKSVVLAMSLSLAFRGWTYGTAAVTLVPQILPLDLESPVYVHRCHPPRSGDLSGPNHELYQLGSLRPA